MIDKTKKKYNKYYGLDKRRKMEYNSIMRNRHLNLTDSLKVDSYHKRVYEGYDYHGIYEPTGDLYSTIEGYEDSWDFDPEQLEIIFNGLQQDLDVEWYANPDFTAEQMEIIYQGLRDGVDVSQYASPDVTTEEMDDFYEKLKQKYGRVHKR